jgi:hypothetical protein
MLEPMLVLMGGHSTYDSGFTLGIPLFFFEENGQNISCFLWFGGALKG